MTQEASLVRGLRVDALTVAYGANLALDKLPAASRERLENACDRALHGVATALHVRYAIGLGNFAARRVAAVRGAHL